MSFSYPLTPNGMYDAMSRDMTTDDPDEVTGEVTSKDLVLPSASAAAPDSKVSRSCNPPSQSGVGVIGVGTLMEPRTVVKRPLVPPPPRPAAKSSPTASPSTMQNPLPKASPSALQNPLPKASPSALQNPLPKASPSALQNPLPKASPNPLEKSLPNAETPSKLASPPDRAAVTARPAPSPARVETPARPRSTLAERIDAAIKTVPPPAKAEATVKPSSPPSERTQIFRPNLNDPKLRRSGAPTAPPPCGELSPQVEFPKQPRVPADIAAASQRRSHGETNSASQRHPESRPREEDDQTRTYSAETVDKLLHGEVSTVKPPRTAADDVTRVGEIPLEEMLLAQAKPSNLGVGHEDVTRVYEMPSDDSKSEATSPRKRIQIDDPFTAPSVIIQAEPSNSRWGWWIACGLLAVAFSAGWVYRAPLGQQVHKLQSSFIRGIGSPKSANGTSPVVAAPMVTVSVSVSPADARLTLDGASVTNPFTAQRPSDKQFHNLAAEAPGYMPLRRTVQFERDLTVVLALAPLPQVAAPQPEENATEPAPAAASEPAPPARTGRVRVRRAAPSVSETPTPPATTPSSCSPPYVIDASGIKAYKPECL